MSQDIAISSWGIQSPLVENYCSRHQEQCQSVCQPGMKGSKITCSHLSLGDSLVAQTVKNLPVMQETWVWSLGQEDPLMEGATYSSTLAWRIPWTEEPGRLQSMESQRVGHDWWLTLSLSSLVTWEAHGVDATFCSRDWQISWGADLKFQREKSDMDPNSQTLKCMTGTMLEHAGALCIARAACTTDALWLSFNSKPKGHWLICNKQTFWIIWCLFPKISGRNKICLIPFLTWGKFVKHLVSCSEWTWWTRTGQTSRTYSFAGSGLQGRFLAACWYQKYYHPAKH